MHNEEPRLSRRPKDFEFLPTIKAWTSVGTIVAILAVVIAGCSDSTRRMSIVDFFPLNNASNVPPDTMVRVKFSSAVKLSSLSSRSFKVEGTLSGKVPGTFALTENERTVTFAPKASYADGEIITVKVTSKVRGKSGVRARRKKFSFGIAPVAEPPPPAQIISRDPERNEVGVALSSPITLEFDKPMDPFTFSGETVAIVGSLTGRIPAQLNEIMTTPTRLVIIPQRDYLPSERITVVLSSGIRSSEEVPFGGDVFSFLAGSLPPTTALVRAAPIPAMGKVLDLVPADLTGDGNLDLVARTEDGTDILVYMGAPKAAFEGFLQLPAGQMVLSLAVLDLNGDDLLDILAGTLDRVVIFTNTTTDGTLSFHQSEFATGVQIHSIISGDIDHYNIGVPDLVLDTETGFHVHRSGFDGPPDQTIGDSRLARTPILLHDLDLNGYLDVVYGDVEGNLVSVQSFDPDDGFGDGGGRPLPNDAREVHVDDLTRDGELEIIALVPNTETGGEDVLFLAVDDDGAAPHAPLTLATMSPSNLTVSDLDGDGWIDILLGNPETADVKLFRNVEGQFENSESLLDNETIYRIVSYDFTGDGVLDLILSAGDELIPLLSEFEPPPENTLTIVGVSADAGTETSVDVRISNESELDGYTVVVGFDNQVLEALDVDLTDTATGALAPEFSVPMIDNASGNMSFNVVFDFLPPFENKVLTSGEDRLLFKPTFRIAADAPLGNTVLEIPNEPKGIPPIETLLTSGGVSVPFTSSGGSINVLEPPPPPMNSLSIAPTFAEVATSGVSVDLLFANEQSVDEFTVLVGFDTAVLSAVGVDLDGTATAGANPDVTETDVDNDAGVLTLHVVIDNEEPRDKVLGVGDSRILLKAIFDVRTDAPAGDTTLTILDGPDENTTSFVGTDGPLTITTTPGTFTVIPGPPEPKTNLSFEPAEAKQGEAAVPIMVLISNETQIEAYTIFVGFDQDVLSPVDVSLAGTATEAANFEFRNIRLAEDGSFVGLDIIFDFSAPFEGNALGVGTQQILLKPIVNVMQLSPPGEHTLRILESADGNDTRLISNGSRLEYTASEGTFTVLEGPPPNNPNRLVIPDVSVSPGASDFANTVRLTSEETIDAFTIIGDYDSHAIEITEFNIVGTVVEPLDPDLVVSRVDPDTDPPVFSFAAIFDAFPPFSQNRLNPGTDLPLVHLVFSVPESTPEATYKLRLRNQLGDPPLSNAIVKEGFNIFPLISGGTVTVRDVGIATFIRGDANGSAKLDLADHIYLVNYVFRKGPKPPCKDAADIDDNGILDMLDMTSILNYLFRATFFPPEPFPLEGPDSTNDSLGCEVGLNIDD